MGDFQLDWSGILIYQDECRDGLYMDMSDTAFNAEKHRAKDDRRFSTWNQWLVWVQRIENKRKNYINNKRPMREPSHLDILLTTRQDYIDEPHVHFETREQQWAALYKIEGQIRKIPTGIQRIEATIEREREEAMPALRSFIERIKRQAGALKTCQRILAAKKIYNTFSRIIRIETVTSTCRALIAGIKINKFVYKRLAFWKGSLHGEWRRAQQQLIWNGTRKHEIHIGNPRNAWRHKQFMEIEFPSGFIENLSKKTACAILLEKQMDTVQEHKGTKPHKLSGLEHMGRRARRNYKRMVSSADCANMDERSGLYRAYNPLGTEEGSMGGKNA